MFKGTEKNVNIYMFITAVVFYLCFLLIRQVFYVKL